MLSALSSESDLGQAVNLPVVLLLPESLDHATGTTHKCLGCIHNSQVIERRCINCRIYCRSAVTTPALYSGGPHFAYRPGGGCLS